MTDTQPFMDEARELCNCVAKAFYELEELDVAAAPLATALSSAYQRGREDAAKIADDYADRAIKANPPAQEASAAAQSIATTIRTERDKG